MSFENFEKRESSLDHISVHEVPDWHQEPATPLWDFEKPLSDIKVEHQSAVVEVSEEVHTVRKHLEDKESDTFFSGPFANVEDITFKDGHINIKTKETDFFTYLASAYAHREHQKDNPIRPLATQGTLIAPDGQHFIIERRSPELSDFPGKLSVFGGALKPNEDPQEALRDRLSKKLGLDLSDEQIHVTGLARDNINNIYCVLFSVQLNEDQYAEGKERAKEAMKTGKRMFYQISADADRKSIERMFLGKRDISEWEPLGYCNLLYALIEQGLRTPEEIQTLMEEAQEKLQDMSLEYTYPMEQYLT